MCLAFWLFLFCLSWKGGSVLKKPLYSAVILLCMLVMLIAPCCQNGAVYAGDDVRHNKTYGDLSVMYYGLSECETGIPGVGTRPMSGFSVYEDANVYFSGRWGVGFDWNSNRVSMGNFTINRIPRNYSDYTISSFGAKVKYQLTNPAETSAALRVFLEWRSIYFGWQNAAYTPSGFGGGIDGYFPLGKNLEGYGQVDWVSANGNVLNLSFNTDVFRYEAGVKYYFSGGNLFARAGYRGENFHFNQNGWNDSSLRGFIIGVGSNF